MAASEGAGTSGVTDLRRLQRHVRRLQYELGLAVSNLPHLRQMVEFSADALLLLDGRQRLLDCNARLAELMEVSDVDLLQQPLEHWLALPQEARVLRNALLELAPGQPLRMEVQLHRSGGGDLPMELEARRVEGQQIGADSLGSLERQPCWTLALRDIRERRRLESSQAMLQVQRDLIQELQRSEHRFRELVELLSDGLATLDPDLRILYGNPALERILGVPPVALQGVPLSRFVPPEERSAWEQHCGALLAGQGRRLRMVLQDAAGSRHFLDMEFIPRREEGGRSEGSLLLARDVSELNAAQRELERLSLSDPLTGLGNELSTHRYLSEHLSQRASIPLALLWLDLDGF
ncbi:MAG: PAS domain-containing protein, partial [Cyanobium sp.]